MSVARLTSMFVAWVVGVGAFYGVLGGLLVAVGRRRGADRLRTAGRILATGAGLTVGILLGALVLELVFRTLWMLPFVTFLRIAASYVWTFGALAAPVLPPVVGVLYYRYGDRIRSVRSVRPLQSLRSLLS